MREPLVRRPRRSANVPRDEDEDWQMEAARRHIERAGWGMGVFAPSDLAARWKWIIKRPRPLLRDLLPFLLELFQSHEKLRERLLSARVDREILMAQKYFLVEAHPELTQWLSDAYQKARALKPNVGWEADTVGRGVTLTPWGDIVRKEP